MADSFVVRIDLDRMLANANAGNANARTKESIKMWLTRKGFFEACDGWICEEKHLLLLNKDEILSKRLLS